MLRELNCDSLMNKMKKKKVLLCFSYESDYGFRMAGDDDKNRNNLFPNDETKERLKNIGWGEKGVNSGWCHKALVLEG